MSHSIAALLLIRLQGRAGTVVPLTDLAAHIGVSVNAAAEHLEALWQSGQVQTERSGPDGVITGAMVIRTKGCPCA